MKLVVAEERSSIASAAFFFHPERSGAFFGHPERSAEGAQSRDSHQVAQWWRSLDSARDGASFLFSFRDRFVRGDALLGMRLPNEIRRKIDSRIRSRNRCERKPIVTRLQTPPIAKSEGLRRHMRARRRRDRPYHNTKTSIVFLCLRPALQST